MRAIENHPPNGDTRHPEAMVFEIQRLSTEDGPGIRTTVFFKGCSLACSWCHNPESISARPQLHWIASRCIGCGTCCTICPETALTLLEGGLAIDRSRCTQCGQCAANCPSTAMEVIGTCWRLDDLVHEVLKDRAYFSNSGGVTAGGGEPGLQAPFLSAFFRTLKEEGIHTAVDTCGCYPRRALEEFLPFTDMVLYDLKEIDPDRHLAFTGRSNEQILDNLKAVGSRMTAGATPQALWIRTPVIPDATATEANIAGLGHWIADHLKGAVTRWELCAFNNLCRDKYLRLDRDWPFKAHPLLSPTTMERLAGIARRSGVDPDIVHWSGSTRMDTETNDAETDQPTQATLA